MTSKNNIDTIYIMSKGRPQCITARTLTRIKYPGEWFIVCGDNDEKLQEYKDKWGDRVIVFNWLEYAEKADLMDNFPLVPSGAVPARNAIANISWSRGEKRHWQFDDDYSGFMYTDFKEVKNKTIKDGKILLEKMHQIAEFADKCDLKNCGFGLSSSSFPTSAGKFQRRVFNMHNMPSNPDKFVKWCGRMSDDLVNVLEVYKQGGIEYSFNWLACTTNETQTEDGGLTEMYKKDGTVRKTAYAILHSPQYVELCIKFGRYHHTVSWKDVSPKLIHEKWRK